MVSSPPLGANAAPLARYRERVRVIPFAIDTTAWQPDEAREPSEPFVFFAGRHVAYKGIDVLLRALQGTSIRAVISGDGPQRVGWDSLARRLGLDGQVRFMGDVSDAELRRCIMQAAALVLPSITRAEAFGYVQLEAMACGTPVISTDLPTGVPWVNQHGVTGLVVPPGDAGALRIAMQTMMSDATLRTTLGAGARARVVSEFGVERLSARLRDLYLELGLLSAAVQC